MSVFQEKKPTVVIVPGAWCRPGLYDILASRLQDAGYQVRILDLPSNGDPPAFASDWKPDVRLISSTVESYADQGEKVVIVAHSAGGGSTTQAADGLSIQNREAAGKEGGILRLVYIAAFAPELGVSPFTHEQVREMFHWALVEDEIDFPDPKLLDEYLFNDCSPEDVSKYRQYVQKSAWRARHNAFTDVTYVGWKHISSSYLICQNDKAVIPDMQEAVVAQEGAKFDDVVRIQSGHSPFISHPQIVERFVRRAAGEDLVVQQDANAGEREQSR